MKGYDEKWIAQRMKGIQDCKELTDTWKGRWNCRRTRICDSYQ